MTEEKNTQSTEAPKDTDHRDTPKASAFKEFMGANWAPMDDSHYEREAVADYAAARRAKISQLFPGERLVIPAGPLKVRSNDCDYRFRPHSAFAHQTGLGLDHEPDAVLVYEPVEPGAGDNGSNHEVTLYFRPLAGRDTDQFYADARYGEFWVGPRPTLNEFAQRFGLRTKNLSELEVAITKNAGTTALGGVNIRLVRDVDLSVDALVDTSRYNTGVALEEADKLDSELAVALSEARIIKDAIEIENLQRSVDMTVKGFEEVVRNLPKAVAHRRGERVVEGSFFTVARAEGNDLGYDTIAACGNNATVLHWIRNNGTVDEGKLLLLDAGVEDDTLYTADVTRTMPVNGKFSPIQAKLYQAVLDAADAAFKVAVPGRKFHEIHTAAMEVLAARLEEWGLLPVSAEVSLSVEGGQHRRWMPHGTSHHLGLDVHDCAKAKAELYTGATLEPGMVFTIEPGLYFKEEDTSIPEEYRGIGIRLEDDVLCTEDGNVNMSAALPRTIEEIESWMERVQNS
ncbi:MAG: aminopeptidase P family protein [Rothia sp. (in: high G+C Gram-positive bacteria)]|uniref:aminopeptidase P family protein n=1 Tax=Rothia sp. (in: high G+C Gram-positive bacteria) TaxID=1885016 RepID=UPI0026E04B5F|nr:aminopeptidase P family protein [Rothia sp. (in: high G+C Gram-positive bacteria)]MDO5750100.1 aminopeptidase P family protein [Rothia sp. (in: high G+C Gram-positive bacteria)]